MTSQAVAEERQSVIDAPLRGFASRMPGLADLLAVPGFVQLAVSNGLAQSFGMRMQGIAVAWVVLELTDSRMWLGIVNGAPAVSIILFSLLGGVLADSRDARRVLIGVRAMLAGIAFLTAVLVSAGQIQLTHLLLYVLATLGLSAIDMPVGRTLMHRVVGTPRLLGATATQSLGMNVTNIVVPMSMGLLIGLAGSGAAFAVLAAGYLVATLLMLRVRVEAPAKGWQSRPLADLLAGLAYLKSTPAVAALVSLGFLLPLAGVYFAMVPVFARDVLGAGAGGLGLLVASFSAGSLTGSVQLVSRMQIGGRGRKVALLSLLFGAGMIAFSQSGSLALSCAISFAMGLTAAFWQNLLTALVQTVAAPEMRGRALSVFTMGFQLASLGWLIGGASASLIGAELTVLAAGIGFAGISTLIFSLSEEAREAD